MTTKAIPANCAQMGKLLRKTVALRMGQHFRCSPEKALERMERPAAKYDAYRVFFVNYTDEQITRALASHEAGQVHIVPGHWSAAMHGVASSLRTNGALVSYWLPGAAA